MVYREVVKMYGTWTNASRILGFGTSSQRMWLKRDYIPIQSQIRIEIMSGGKLKAERKHCLDQFKQYKPVKG